MGVSLNGGTPKTLQNDYFRKPPYIVSLLVGGGYPESILFHDKFSVFVVHNLF